MAKKPQATWKPTAEDYHRVFREQNPWHVDGKVPEALAYRVERPLAKFLWQRLMKSRPRRFQLILGPRRVGKSTSMYQAVRSLLAAGVSPKRLWWLKLDHPLLMPIPLDILVNLVRGTSRPTTLEPVYLFLDELTYSSDWDLWLKNFHDQTWPVRIAGSSSSTAALRDKKPECGVGRWDEQALAPYLFAEYLDLVNRHVDIPICDTLAATISACIGADVQLAGLAEQRRRFLLTGGFPELLLAGEAQAADEASVLLQSQRTLRNDSIERAIYKDIPQAFGVENPLLLERTLYTLAGQVTGILSPSTITQNLDGLSQPTFDKYLSYLERAFLVFTLPNYSGAESSVQKRGRKLYFVDGAVRNAALQRGVGPLYDDYEMGLLAENMAAGHLFAESQQSQVRLYHWRDKRDEIDLVYDHPDGPLAFEMASSAGHHRKGIRAFMSRFPRFEGRCYLVAPDAPARRPEDELDRIGALPLDLFLLAVSAQAERGLKNRLSP
jgi:predicted AAA+ superfamily ATPase